MRRACFLRLERDHELRRRIAAQRGGGNIIAIQASTAHGKALDELAELVQLRRKIVEDVA